MNRQQYASERFYSVLNRRGAKIKLRNIQTTSGANPLINPARVTNLTVSGTHNQGVTSITVTGAPLAGRFIAGDVLLINGVRFLVQAEAQASSNSAAVSVLPALPWQVNGGTAVTVEWKNDEIVPAAVAAYAQRLIDGSLIESGDLSVTISAHRLKNVPSLSTIVVLPGEDIRKIVAISPQLVEGIAISYSIQVR